MRIFTIAVFAVLSQVNWPTYGFTYENTRDARVSQINRSNVARLSPVWHFNIGPHEHVETTPIVVGGTMYLTEGVGNNVIALDAVSGKQKWRYRPSIGFISPCCGAINRGVAIEGDKVFFATLDSQLIALNAASGKQIWVQRIGNPSDGLSETMAPLAWSGEVFIGSSGSDLGLRGSFSAYNAADGKLLWRWYAVSPGWEGSYVRSVHGVSLNRNVRREMQDAAKYSGSWKHGGGAVWMTPALDTRSHTLYITTWNPHGGGAERPGDNLYTECIIALDARSGVMRWYYQETPHDIWEYEASSPPLLFETPDSHGHAVPALAQAGKTRWFYILRRDNGRLLRLTAYAPNRGVYEPPGPDPVRWPFRGSLGPISYDKDIHLAYVSAIEQRNAGEANASWRYFVSAVDVDTGKVAWRRMLNDWQQGDFGDHMVPGGLSTGGLLFVSEPEGRFFALDPANGAVLWQWQLGDATEDVDENAGALQHLAHRLHDWLKSFKRSILRQAPPAQRFASVSGNPIVYEAGGQTYVAIGFDAAPDRASGGAVFYAFALPHE